MKKAVTIFANIYFLFHVCEIGRFMQNSGISYCIILHIEIYGLRQAESFIQYGMY